MARSHREIGDASSTARLAAAGMQAAGVGSFGAAASGSTAGAAPDSSALPPGRDIRVLPDHVVDQIAAGEVVERPSSVVKELVENALDAGASHITIEVETGGKDLIRVLDNGWGMTEASARLALQRHATSKLRSVEDLFVLDTMGFRGEALPSIAAVSRMTLITRVREEVAGTRLEIEGGQIVSVSQVGAPVGTQLEVRDLLFNVPARLKFLKGNATEASHVTETVTKLAMAHPAVHIRLRHGGRTALEAPMHPNRLERVKALLGPRMGRRLHEVRGQEGGILVDAYLAAPDLAQTTARGVQLYVGRRPVKDRGLLHAITMGYGELVPKGKYPVAVLFVDAPQGVVDVNVHPQKLEVRFSDPQLVYAAVRHTIRRGVAEAPWLSEDADDGGSPVRMRAIAASRPPPADSASALAVGHAAETTRMLLPFGRSPGMARPGVGRYDEEDGEEEGGSDIRQARFPLASEALADSGASRAAEPGPVWPYRLSGTGKVMRVGSPEPSPAPSSAAPSGPVAGAAMPSRPVASAAAPVAPDVPVAPIAPIAPVAPVAPVADDAHPEQPGVAHAIPGRPDATQDADGWSDAAREDRAPGWGSRRPYSDQRDAATFFSRLRYLGQLDRTYLICEAEGELVLVDQHAAHERVAFQRLRERHREHAVPVQRLLFPQTIELEPHAGAVAEDSRETLASLGFELEPFGGSTYAIKAVPAGLRQSEVGTVLSELLGELAERGGSRALEERLDLALATIACHSVVRAGDILSEQEVTALFRSMDGVDFKAHCPHGRPVLLRISVSEIARRFGRT